MRIWGAIALCCVACGSAPPPASNPVPPEESAWPRARPDQRVAWVAWGIGAAAAVGATWSLVDWHAARQDAESSNAAVARDAEDDAHRSAIFAGVGYGLAAVGLGVGLWFYLEAEDGPAVGLAPTPDGLGVVGRF